MLNTKKLNRLILLAINLSVITTIAIYTISPMAIGHVKAESTIYLRASKSTIAPNEEFLVQAVANTSNEIKSAEISQYC